MIPADTEKATIEEVCDEEFLSYCIRGEYTGVEVGEGHRRKTAWN